jgi:hypothetical protein
MNYSVHFNLTPIQYGWDAGPANFNNVKEILKHMEIPYFIYYNYYIKIDITKGDSNIVHLLNEFMPKLKIAHGITKSKFITQKEPCVYEDGFFSSGKAVKKICEKCYTNEIFI